MSQQASATTLHDENWSASHWVTLILTIRQGHIRETIVGMLAK